jgi:biotin carboxylase
MQFDAPDPCLHGSPGTDLVKYVQGVLPLLGPALVKADFGAGGHSMTLVETAEALREQVAGFLPEGYDDGFLVEEYLGSAKDVLSVSYNGMVEQDGRILTLAAGRHFLHAAGFTSDHI